MNILTVNVWINPSKVVIIKFRLNKDHKSLFSSEARERAIADKKKGTKFTQEDIIQRVD